MEVIYEDNHIIAVNKAPGEIVMIDQTGDTPLTDAVKVYLKEKYDKPGNVFLGLPHRIDRPTSGIVLMARNSKVLGRFNKMFQRKETIRKIYWAVVDNPPIPSEGTLEHWITRSKEVNKSYAHDFEAENSKHALLHYRTLASSDNYSLLEIELITGRHHQIRAQLSKIGIHIKGDIKYGFPRPNPEGAIHLHARRVEFLHPVRKDPVVITADPPDEPLWNAFRNILQENEYEEDTLVPEWLLERLRIEDRKNPAPVSEIIPPPDGSDEPDHTHTPDAVPPEE
jgi:23S rRNA pseudouridine1911/1915/1917 synthase